MLQSKTEFKTEAPSIYKKSKSAEDQQQTNTDGDIKQKRQRKPKNAEGASRPRGFRRNRGIPNPNSKTLYIGRVYYDELDQDTNISQKLNNERLKLLREVFQRYGDVEKFEPNTAESFVHVTYRDRSFAEDAITYLTQRSVRNQIIDEIKDQLRRRNLPESVCPVLWKYRYEWSKTTQSGAESPQGVRPKTAVAKKGTEQKEVQATPAPVVESGDQKAQESKKKKKNRTKKGDVQQNSEESAIEATQTEAKQEKKKAPVQDLQLEAEHARLTLDLEYLRTQHKSVLKEIHAERDRCHSRDERIKRLEEEHGRVRQHLLTLENQLKTDLSWKAAADERMSKLQEEIAHLQQEQHIVSKMLQSIPEL
jgi:hypothetical protein